MQSQPVKSIFMFQSIALVFNIFFIGFLLLMSQSKVETMVKILVQGTTNGRLICNSVTSE